MESFWAGIEHMNGNIKASPRFAFKIPQGIGRHLLSLLFIFLAGFQQQESSYKICNIKNLMISKRTTTFSIAVCN